MKVKDKEKLNTPEGLANSKCKFFNCFSHSSVFDRTEQDKDRTFQGRTGQDKERRGFFPLLKSLWYFQSIGKSNGKKWSQIWEFLFESCLKSTRKKNIVFFADLALQNMVETTLPDGLETSGRRVYCWLPFSRFPLTSQSIKRNLDGSIFGWLSWWSSLSLWFVRGDKGQEQTCLQLK